MSQIREGGGWVVHRCGFSLFGGSLQFFLGQLPRNFKYVIRILSSSPVDCHPF